MRQKLNVCVKLFSHKSQKVFFSTSINKFLRLFRFFECVCSELKPLYRKHSRVKHILLFAFNYCTISIVQKKEFALCPFTFCVCVEFLSIFHPLLQTHLDLYRWRGRCLPVSLLNFILNCWPCSFRPKIFRNIWDHRVCPSAYADNGIPFGKEYLSIDPTLI